MTNIYSFLYSTLLNEKLKKMRKIFVLGIVSILLNSCHKENETPLSDDNEIKYSVYLPMSIGNYWVYKLFELDTSGNEYQTSTFDSIIISKDTLINGNKFFRFDYFRYNSKNAFPIDTIYCRDSLKNLINSKGQLLFSEDNYSDTLLRKIEIIQGDTLYTMTCKMERLNKEYSVPTGNYNDLLNFKGTVTVNSKYCTNKNPRYTNKYYAKDVGEIFHSQICICCDGFLEKRLVRYKINK